MADGAVLAHHILVLEHHARLGAVIGEVVGPAGEVDHLIGLDPGGARVDRVGSDAGEVVDLEGGDGAVFRHADLRLDAMVAGVNVGDETLDAVGDEFHRTPEQLRQRHRRHLVGIGVHLDAEGAADVLGHHPHLMLGEVEVLGKQVLHHVRRLRALVDGEALLALVPVGDDGARLGGDAGMASGDKGSLDHGVRLSEGLVRRADLELALKAEVVAEGSMNHRRLGIERGLRIGDGEQRLIIDLDQLGGVLGLGARARDGSADGFALPAGTVDGDGRLRRRFEALQVRKHADPGRHHFGQFGAGDHGDDAGCLLRRVGLDRGDFGVSMRRAHKGDVRHARQRNVADILPAALGEAMQIRPRHRAADIGIGPVERGEHGRGIVGDFHALTKTALATGSCATCAPTGCCRGQGLPSAA